VSKVATVKQLTRSQYQVTLTSTEFQLIKSALQQAERISRFQIHVLDEAEAIREGGLAENSVLRREIDALAMREASLRSLQKTMTEIDHVGKLAPIRYAGLDRLGRTSVLRIPPPR
jgi:hypothetical protein